MDVGNVTFEQSQCESAVDGENALQIVKLFL